MFMFFNPDSQRYKINAGAPTKPLNNIFEEGGCYLKKKTKKKKPLTSQKKEKQMEKKIMLIDRRSNTCFKQSLTIINH